MSKATFDPARYNTSSNPSFDTVLKRHVSRRGMLRSGSAMAALGMMSSFGLSGCGGMEKTGTQPEGLALGFESIKGCKTNAVAVAGDYRAQVLAPWGTPLNDNAMEWQADGSNTAQDQLNSVGMHHDGMGYFPLDDSSDEGLLCINHEYVDQKALHPNGATKDALKGKRMLAEEVRKEIYAHGVTVVRVKRNEGTWCVVKNDPHNKRYTGATEMLIAGPLAGSPLVATKFSPAGTSVRGTLNNCGSGTTPWGTFLTCEENWPGYFTNRGTRTADQARLGIPTGSTRYGWEDLAGDKSQLDDEFARFDVTPSADSAIMDYRNEANGHGYVVEIDPYDAGAMAVKRTALGRFRHEACVLGKLAAGKPVVFYSGHDARFEYIYKFVSEELWDPADASPGDRLATGAKYMDRGTLYVARFDEDGSGEWLPLTLSSATADGTLADAFASEAELILNTPGAADLVGATPMDRPEWAAVDPVTGTVYLTLTNNTARTEETNPANPRLNNKFGHIIRWDEGSSATEFTWDIFVFGAPADGASNVNLSGLTDLNQFASPDGLMFDKRGIMWIQTDNGANEVAEDVNDQMLAVVPSTLAAGETITADNQSQLKRLFVGPNGSEVTGLAFNPAHTSFFVNVQHPANWPFSVNATEETPAGVTVRPRAATVVIEKLDGNPVGE